MERKGAKTKLLGDVLVSQNTITPLYIYRLLEIIISVFETLNYN